MVPKVMKWAGGLAMLALLFHPRMHMPFSEGGGGWDLLIAFASAEIVWAAGLIWDAARA